MPAIQLDEIESRTLVTIHSLERPFAGSEIPSQQIGSVAPGWEYAVPKYLIYAVVQGKMGVSYISETPVDRALHSLEKLGLIEHSPPKFGRLLTGRWTLPDGRTIETCGKCGEAHGGGPWWELGVFIDGTRAFGLSGPPDMTFPQFDCYRLTEKGLVVVRAQAELAGEKNGKRQGKQPAWQRLVIVKSDTGDDIARLDGKEHRLTGASDATFLELLQRQQGGPILSATLERSCDDRPARVYARLPKAIQRIIDKPGQRTGKKGYRML